MISIFLAFLVAVRQAWRRLQIYKLIFFQNPSLFLRRFIWPYFEPLISTVFQSAESHPDSNLESQPLVFKPSTHEDIGRLLDHKKMPPIPVAGLPRLVIYFQSHHNPDGSPISMLPLIQQPGVRLTHLMLAAFHINRKPDPADIITLNDHLPSHPSFAALWAEARILQASGVKLMGMLGGAARGAFSKDTLDSDEEAVFERYYGAVRDMVRERGLDGLDLDVEEPFSLAGIVRLIDRLRADFGPDFIISLAPVAPALLDPRRNLSGFDYEALEVMRGREIAFYNCQFYCGWGDCSNPILYEMMLMKGWAPEKVVVGLVTNPRNGSGFIPFDVLATVIPLMVGQHQRFGGIMGWEYFNSLPGGHERPWEWAQFMTSIMKAERIKAPDVVMPVGRIEDQPVQEKRVVEADGGDGAGEKGKEAPLPGAFDYYSDGLGEE